MSKPTSIRPRRLPKPVTKTSNAVHASPDLSRRLNYESLETRCVLSADGLDVMSGEPVTTEITQSYYVAAEDPSAEAENSVDAQVTEIKSLQLRINGQVQEVTENFANVTFAAGDEIEIVGVDYHYGGAEPEGVFALEAYVNKLTDYANASLVDYEDGRFSEQADDVQSIAGDATHQGVKGSWILEAGWDRVTVNLMHYTSNGATVAGRFAVQLEVDTPDFAFDTEVIDQLSSQTVVAGDEVEIPVAWKNTADGKFHSYAEVDVYAGTDRSGPIVWAGAVVGNADASNTVTGTAMNTRGDFTHLWTPTEPGTYTLHYVVDPEHTWAEENESNNVYELVVEVQPANEAPVAVDDVAVTEKNTDVQIDVVENDHDADGDPLNVNGYTQAENGSVTLNEDGTLTYTPDEGFVGDDRFEYTVSDGEETSNSAVVHVSVEAKDIDVEAAQGNEDEWIPLSIEVDAEQIAAVEIHDVPDGAELSHGEQGENNYYTVSAADLGDLQIKHTRNSDVDFTLNLVTVTHEGTYGDSAELAVTVDPVYDGGRFGIQSFGIEAGSSGNLPHHFKLFDGDGSEVARITINNLPDFISLSAGYRDGDNWILEGDDMTRNLKVIAGYADDISGWSSFGFGYYYQKFSLTADVKAWELDSGEGGEGQSKFDMYVFQQI